MRRSIAFFLLGLIVASSLARGAGSIFDEESFEDPKIEGPVRRAPQPSPPPANVDSPAEPAQPEPVAPAPSETAPAKPPEPAPVVAAEPAKPALPIPFDLEPRELIKRANEQIKSAGPLPARLADEKMISVFHEKAVAHAMLGELPAARDAMQKVLNAAKWNRTIVLNSARIDVAGKADAMRAVTGLEKYHKTAGQPDEQAVELWGMALATYAKSRGRIPQEKEAAFIAAQTALEKTRTGQRRWGNAWLPESEYKKIEDQRTAALKEIEGIVKRLKQAQARYDKLDYDARHNPRTGRVREPDPTILRQMDQVDVEIGRLKQELAEARKKLPRPKWVIALRMDEPDPTLVAK